MKNHFYLVIFLSLAKILESQTFSLVGLNGGVTANKQISCLFTDTINDILYAGGNFTTIDGVTVNGLAKWNGSNWFAVGTHAFTTVNDIKYYNGKLYIVTGNALKAWDGLTWTNVGNSTSGVLTCLEVYNGNLYIGGSFQYWINTSNPSGSIVKYNGSVFSYFDPASSIGAPVADFSDMIVSNNILYLGGNITSIQKNSTTIVPAQYFISYNGTNWNQNYTCVANTYTVGTSIVLERIPIGTVAGDVVIGGAFTTANGFNAQNLTGYNPTMASCATYYPQNTPGGLAVTSLKFKDSTMYGVMINASGNYNFSKIDNSTGLWTTIFTGTSIQCSGNSMASYHNELYIGANFTSGFGIGAKSIVKFSNQTTGISSNLNQEGIKIFPNPSSSIINISNQNMDLCQIEISDNLGKTVQRLETNDQNIKLDLKELNLKPAIYQVRVVNKKSCVSKAIVLQ